MVVNVNANPFPDALPLPHALATGSMPSSLIAGATLPLNTPPLLVMVILIELEQESQTRSRRYHQDVASEFHFKRCNCGTDQFLMNRAAESFSYCLSRSYVAMRPTFLEILVPGSATGTGGVHHP